MHSRRSAAATRRVIVASRRPDDECKLTSGGALAMQRASPLEGKLLLSCGVFNSRNTLAIKRLWVDDLVFGVLTSSFFFCPNPE